VVSALGEYDDNISVGLEKHWANKCDKMKDLCDEYVRDNIMLMAELTRAAKRSRETTKRKMRVQLDWTGEEANLAENVANYCRTYLFPHYKFLKDKWDVFDPDHHNSV